MQTSGWGEKDSILSRDAAQTTNGRRVPVSNGPAGRGRGRGKAKELKGGRVEENFLRAEETLGLFYFSTVELLVVGQFPSRRPLAQNLGCHFPRADFWTCPVSRLIRSYPDCWAQLSVFYGLLTILCYLACTRIGPSDS